MALTDRINAGFAAVAAEINALRAGKVESTTIVAIVRLTQAEYDALGTPDPDTLYVVVG